MPVDDDQGIEPQGAAEGEGTELPVDADQEAEQAALREKELAADLSAAQDRLLRALAETENLRRRSARELEEAHKYAVTGFARELLDVADNLSRALSSIPPRAREELDFVKTLADGVAMTQKMLEACFERNRIAQVKPALGEKFDHNRHQAMFEVESAEHPPGTIAQVMQPGYVIADRLLRPAMVGIAKAPPVAAEADPSEASEASPPPEAPATGSGTGSATGSGGAEPGACVDTTA